MNKYVRPICIIPARGGSKRIKNKNIRKFNRKPIISYTISAANKTKIFSKILVSSESNKVKNVVNRYLNVIFLKRPFNLATDKIPTRPVIKQALIEYSKKFGLPKYICYMTSTAPFIRADDIKKAYNLLLKNNKINFVVSVTKFSYPILRSLKISKSGKISFWKKKYIFSRSQDLGEFYHDAGQFYWAKSEAILKEKPTFSNTTLPFIIPSYRVIDIDEEEDWKKALLMSKYL